MQRTVSPDGRVATVERGLYLYDWRVTSTYNRQRSRVLSCPEGAVLDLDTARDAADFSIAFLHCPEYRLTRTMSLDHPKTVVREARLFQEFVRGFAFARAAILDFYWCELHGVVHSEMCDRPEGCHRIYRGEPCLS